MDHPASASITAIPAATYFSGTPSHADRGRRRSRGCAARTLHFVRRQIGQQLRGALEALFRLGAEHLQHYFVDRARIDASTSIGGFGFSVEPPHMRPWYYRPRRALPVSNS